MPHPRELSVDDVSKAVKETVSKGSLETIAFYGGDHWQGGAGYIGPLPPEGDELRDPTLREVRRWWTPVPITAEVIDRHTAGVASREPAWRPTPRRALGEGQAPSPEEVAGGAEAAAMLTSWSNTRGLHGKLKEAVVRMLTAQCVIVRAHVPRQHLVEGKVPRGTIEECLNRIDITVSEAGGAALLDDPGHGQVGAYLYAREGRAMAEVVYVADGLTVVRQIGGGEAEESEGVDLGGRLTMWGASRREFFGEEERASQRALNFANFLIPKNATHASFLERIFIDILAPGHLEADPDRPGKKRYVPDKYKIGGSTTSFLSSQVKQTEDGRPINANGSVVFREGAEPTITAGAKREHRSDILNAVGQAHVLMADDATASGRSRQEARAEYAASLGDTAEPLTKLMASILEGVLAMAEAFSGSPGHYTSTLRIDVECRLDVGPISPEEQQQIAANVEAGLMSTETAMSRIGIQDVDAEVAKLRSEPSFVLGNIERVYRTLRAGQIRSAKLDRILASEALRLTGLVPDNELEAVLTEIEESATASRDNAARERGALGDLF